MSKSLKSRIGYSRTGRPLELNYEIREETIESDLSVFTVEEKIEILCILEFILYKRFTLDESDFQDSKLVNTVFEYLNEKRLDPEFANQLEAMR